mgnify:CR=1 FL=1
MMTTTTSEQQMKYIKKRSDILTIDQRRSIYNTVRSNVSCTSAIRDADDVYIDLEKLTPNILEYIYNIVKARQEELKIIP